MDLTYEDLVDGIRLITLTGRLDLEGTERVALKFTTLTATLPLCVIVDLGGVEFLSSIGVATLVRNAKALRLRSGNMVLVKPTPNVSKVLASTRVDKVIPICRDLEEARLVVKTGGTQAALNS